MDGNNYESDTEMRKRKQRETQSNLYISYCDLNVTLSTLNRSVCPTLAKTGKANK